MNPQSDHLPPKSDQSSSTCYFMRFVVKPISLPELGGRFNPREKGIFSANKERVTGSLYQSLKYEKVKTCVSLQNIQFGFATRFCHLESGF